jgi:hypothetical protein
VSRTTSDERDWPLLRSCMPSGGRYAFSIDSYKGSKNRDQHLIFASPLLGPIAVTLAEGRAYVH